MTSRHLQIKHLLLTACPALSMAVAPGVDAARAHVHGQGTLDIALESGQIELLLIAPDADLKENREDSPAVLETRYGQANLIAFAGAVCQLEAISGGPADDLEADWFEDDSSSEESHEHADHDHEHSEDEHSEHGHSDHDREHAEHDDHDHDEDDHAEHDDEGHDEEAHGDTQISWTFRCSRNPTSVTVQLFDVTSLTEIKVQAVGESGAIGATLTPDDFELELP